MGQILLGVARYNLHDRLDRPQSAGGVLEGLRQDDTKRAASRFATARLL